MSDDHSALMNAFYNLDEPEWPNHFTTTDYDVQARFGLLSTHVRADETPAERHTRERVLFALWHEIERRGLLRPDEPAPPAAHSYPWEGVEEGAHRLGWSQLLEEDVIGYYGDVGSPTYSKSGPPNCGRKVPKKWIPVISEDEEMYGIWRREPGGR